MIDLSLRQRILDAILLVRAEIRWKPNKGEQHLQTRVKRKHLLSNATLVSYESIIKGIIFDEAARVYIYRWNIDVYPTIVGDYEDKIWLVMFSLDGVMETAFPPSNPHEYFADPKFEYAAGLKELFDG